jgi:hypothetical protein
LKKKKKITKWSGGVAQRVGPSLKPQYRKKKKKRKSSSGRQPGSHLLVDKENMDSGCLLEFKLVSVLRLGAREL